ANALACCMGAASLLGEDPTTCNSSSSTQAQCQAMSASDQTMTAYNCAAIIEAGAFLGVAACQ
ncbi:MAG TPA: hypothetical protein VK841_23765, partial [Polyangiaceae bacterium]|nr:hypothetical protein [Polyangiaceae bacterium]